MNKTVIIENDLSFAIRGIAFKVHDSLGPGLLESVYETALAYELRENGFDVKTQVPIPMRYKEIKMDIGFRIDIMVNDLIIIEVKSVEALADVHHKQLLTYLKLTGKKLGLPINFNSYPLKNGIVRIANKL